MAVLGSIRFHLLLGLMLVAILLGAVGTWSATTNIAGAVIASGSVAVETNVKKVQHDGGGIVGEILARDGDRVAAGDILVRLDSTRARASLGIINNRLIELIVRRARLVAEQAGKAGLTWSQINLPSSPSSTSVRLFEREKKILQARTAARSGQVAQLKQQIDQLQEEISGLISQANAKSQEINLVQRELEGARTLWNKGLMPITKLTTIEREATRTKGELGKLNATIARTRARIAEKKIEVLQIDRDLATEIANQLAEIGAKIAELEERKVAAEDQLKRLDIRAPQGGIIHQSVVHTVGGVINTAETIMLVVPNSGKLTIEARITPQDIDQLHVGQAAVLRFTAFNQRTTPEVQGRLARVSADVTADGRTGDRYYLVRISIPDAEVQRLGSVSLVPGMPVEVFIKTGDRSVISYLMKPMTDQFMRAFRER